MSHHSFYTQDHELSPTLFLPSETSLLRPNSSSANTLVLPRFIHQPPEFLGFLESQSSQTKSSGPPVVSPTTKTPLPPKSGTPSKFYNLLKVYNDFILTISPELAVTLSGLRAMLRMTSFLLLSRKSSMVLRACIDLLTATPIR